MVIYQDGKLTVAGVTGGNNSCAEYMPERFRVPVSWYKLNRGDILFRIILRRHMAEGISLTVSSPHGAVVL